MHSSAFKKKTYDIIFGTETAAGRYFDIALIIIILLSVLCIVLDSIDFFTLHYDKMLFIAEWCFTIIFTLEYFIRLYISPNRRAYAFSFYGVVDFLAVIPTYISLFISSANFLVIVRLLRILRIFRILKLFQYITEAHILMRSLKMARRKIYIFMFFVSIVITLFGSLMYIIEGPEYGFTSIPRSMYWAIVTMTTVGYGDITPQTVLGQIIASLAMLTGYAILAVPTGILSAEIITEIQRDRHAASCRNCERSGHESDALYCKYCGTELWFRESEKLPSDAKKE